MREKLGTVSGTRRCLLACTAAVGALGLAAAANGGTVYNDSFTSQSGDLAGSTPDVTDAGGGAWGESLPNTYDRGGGEVVANNAGNGYGYGTSLAPGSYSGGTGIYAYTGAYLPVNTSPANTLSGTVDFNLTVTVKPGAEGTAVGIGLLDAPLGNYSGFNSNSLGFVNDAGGYVSYGNSSSGTNYDFSYGPGYVSAVEEISYSASAQMLTYLVGGVTIATQSATTAQIADLQDVDFGFSDSGSTPPTASVSSFELTVASSVPEPAPAAFAALSSSILFVMRRRHRTLGFGGM